MKLVTKENIAISASVLAARDAEMSMILDRFGPPPLWGRRPGFATLVQIILEQQVSLASARAAFRRLKEELSAITPDSLMTLDDPALKAIGFSRQKSRYCRLLAQSMIERKLNLASLNRMSDEDARLELKKIKGVGAWTADIYLLMALRRPDVWPVGDLALLVALQRLKRMSSRPNVDEFESLGERWKPYRAVAARMLWHYYLCERSLRNISR